MVGRGPHLKKISSKDYREHLYLFMHNKNCDTITGGSVLASAAQPPARVTGFLSRLCQKIIDEDRQSQVWRKHLKQLHDKFGAILTMTKPTIHT